MILGASGENIYPEEIEALINTLRLRGGVPGHRGRQGADRPDPAQARGDREPQGQRPRTGIEDVGARRRRTLAGEDPRRKSTRALSAFNRISKVAFHHEPFEKTPTQKIKRFLYPKKRVE
ncbi:MAG: hypothetical protein M0C28_37660 [Candidatus Moduliflexus flocculans]|nr:hypothetical protein [Candidatus Moduliflexus flocculans]